MMSGGGPSTSPCRHRYVHDEDIVSLQSICNDTKMKKGLCMKEEKGSVPGEVPRQG